MLPINTINTPVYNAGMPALSRLLDQPARYRSMFGQLMQKLGLLTMPAFALSAVTADWVVEILFGPSWRQAIPLVALFSVSANFLPVLMAVFMLYLTQARTAEMLRATLVDAALTVAAILAGLPWGVTGVAASIAIAGLAVRAPPVSIALAIALVVGGLRPLTPDPTPVALSVVVATALVLALAGLLAWPETRREVRQVLAGGKLSLSHS
jgi:PST family polysaccharide transporter